MVMQALLRKAGHILEDPVLRRWLLRRIVGLEKSPAAFDAGRPPYLSAVRDNQPAEAGQSFMLDFPTGKFSLPSASIQIDLPGKSVDLDPEKPEVLFTRSYDDLETLLAAHRFAWVPIAGDAINPDWVALLWRVWCDRFGHETSGWPWHAYTAAERAINLIDFSRRFGLPGDPNETSGCCFFMRKLFATIWSILANTTHQTICRITGRGLLRIGTALGRRIMPKPAQRSWWPRPGGFSGGPVCCAKGQLTITCSSRGTISIPGWMPARPAWKRPPCFAKLRNARWLRIPGLRLPGGMPLIGDISPDVSPLFLGRFIGAGNADTWPGNLSPDRQQDALEMLNGASPVSPDRLADDGWHRFGAARLACVVLCAPRWLAAYAGAWSSGSGQFRAS